jgi:hypothetical protein
MELEARKCPPVLDPRIAELDDAVNCSKERNSNGVR